MEDPKLLNNDEEDDNLLVVDDIRRLEIHDNKSSTPHVLGSLLSKTGAEAYSSNNVLKGSLTLRECNMEYGNANGCKYDNHELPEFDRCTTKGCISPLRRFQNSVGHFVHFPKEQQHMESATISLKPELLSSISEFTECLRIELGTSIRRGHLWALLNCNICSKRSTGKWYYGSEEVEQRIGSTLTVISSSFDSPLSAHTQHAWLESSDTKDSTSTLGTFKQPEETTAVTGIFGTLQNNQLIDLAQENDNSTIDVSAREEDIEYPGFLCSGHTAHSTEAGRVRRVCHKVSIRVLNKQLLDKLYKACTVNAKSNEGPKQWILFCMGKLVYCTTKFLLQLRNFLVSLSSTNINTATVHINAEAHVAIVSISSGTLIRRDVNNLAITTLSLTSDTWPDGKYTPIYPNLATDEGFKFYFSGFFQLTPYIPFDRPPRTLISSVQSVQVVTLPWGAGTSSVAPTHSSRPLVSTPLIEELIEDSSATIADYVPGEDLVVCFANFNDTNEDSIMISDGSVGRGLFAHMAYSMHCVNNTEVVPDVSNKVTIEKNRWWKSYSRRTLSNNNLPQSMMGDKQIKPIVAGGDGSGTVISKSTTASGQISVKVLRYSTPCTGDKIATGHGQKGVVKLIKEADMPWGIDDNNEPIKFDIVVSLSSITNRLTNGQYYEMVSGVNATKTGKRLIINPSTYHDEHMETVLYDGKSGNLIERLDEETGDIQPISASWGINRVWQMTQLTWDKQHYTHNTAGKHSISTNVGRTAGGGIKFGEMESHACASSGLKHCHNELRRRINVIDIHICIRCDKLAQMCMCGNDTSWTLVSMPHSMMVFDYANLLTLGYVMKYKVTF